MDELELLDLFSKNLKRLMKEENITQEELARKVDISRTMISRYIVGQCLPSFLTVVKITDVLCCSIDELIEE